MLEFGQRDEGEIRVIEISGALKILNAPELKEVIDECKRSGKLQLVVDMSNLTYVDSSGLGMLINSGRELRGEGGNILLACVPENIHDMLRVAGLLQFFQVFESTAAAAAHYAG